MSTDTGTSSIVIRPIGVIHTPHTEPSRTPIQPVYAAGMQGRVEVFDEFAEGLADIEGFSHLHLLYHFHREDCVKLTVTPFLEDSSHGVFATRAMCRPNHIGMSIVRLVRREGTTLYIDDVDILDGAPLLDIKPYCARFDVRTDTRNGWQDTVDETIAQQRGRRQ